MPGSAHRSTSCREAIARLPQDSMDAGNKLITATNVAIVAVALTLGVVCVKKYVLNPASNPSKPAEPAPIIVGTHISIPDVVWSRSRKTMVVASGRLAS